MIENLGKEPRSNSRWLAVRDVLLVGICAVLSGCASPIVVPGLQERLVGYWDWSIRDEVCSAETAHNITFSPDGTRMYVNHPPGTSQADGTPRPFAEYEILGSTASTVRGRITDERRRTEDGALVVWDLVLFEQDAYCWRHKDMRAGDCSAEIHRCPLLNAARRDLLAQ